MKELSKKRIDELTNVFASDSFKTLIETMQKASKEDTGSFSVVISTDDEDRGGDIVVQEGIETDNYMKNPVVLVNHDYWGLPAGVTDSLRRETDAQRTKTIADGRFAPTEMGQTLRKLYDAKMLHATSIGLRVKERDEEGRILRWELLEWSWVSVPMNQNAVVSLVGEKMFKSLSELGIIKTDVTIEDDKDEDEKIEEETTDEPEEKEVVEENPEEEVKEEDEESEEEVEEVEEVDDEEETEEEPEGETEEEPEKNIATIQSLEKTINEALIALDSLKKGMEGNKGESEEETETKEDKEAKQYLAFQKACKSLTANKGEKVLQEASTKISLLLHEIKKNR